MRVLLFLPLLWAAGCQQLLCLNAGKPYPGDVSGTSTAATGGAPCTTPEECMGEDGECGHRTCDGGVCGYLAEAPLTPCSGNGVCDGSGNCALGDHVFSAVYGDDMMQQAEAVAIDSQDAILFGGHYFGNLAIGQAMLMSGGPFVAKLNAGGAPQWATASEGTLAAYVYGLAVRPGDSVGVTGRFTDTLDFGMSISADDNMAGSGDVFAVELDGDGNYLWSKPYGDQLDQSGAAIAVGADGNLVLAGSFEGGIEFNKPLDSHGGKDLFVASIAPEGVGAWSFATGDGGLQRALDVATHPDGSIVAAGQFSGTVSFENNTFTSVGPTDFLVIRWQAGPTFAWAKQFGGVGGDYAEQVAVDAQGNIVVAGVCSDIIGFGGDEHTLVTAGLCVAKLTSAGDYVWSKDFSGSGSGHQLARGLAVDGAGNAIMVGYFDATIDFDPPETAPGDGSAIFVIKLSATTGDELWSHVYGGGVAYDVAVDSQDNIVVVGFADGVNGLIQFGDDPITLKGGNDAFVLKLSP